MTYFDSGLSSLDQQGTIMTTLSMFESLTFLNILAMTHFSKDNFVLTAFFQVFTNKLKTNVMILKAI
jgi:hypothetical protein